MMTVQVRTTEGKGKPFAGKADVNHKQSTQGPHSRPVLSTPKVYRVSSADAFSTTPCKAQARRQYGICLDLQSLESALKYLSAETDANHHKKKKTTKGKHSFDCIYGACRSEKIELRTRLQEAMVSVCASSKNIQFTRLGARSVTAAHVRRHTSACSGQRQLRIVIGHSSDENRVVATGEPQLVWSDWATAVHRRWLCRYLVLEKNRGSDTPTSLCVTIAQVS